MISAIPMLGNNELQRIGEERAKNARECILIAQRLAGDTAYHAGAKFLREAADHFEKAAKASDDLLQLAATPITED